MAKEDHYSNLVKNIDRETYYGLKSKVVKMWRSLPNNNASTVNARKRDGVIDGTHLCWTVFKRYIRTLLMYKSLN